VTDQKKHRSLKTVFREEHDATCLSGLTKCVDYVECAICGLIGTKIAKHVSEVHCLSREAYEAEHGSLTCEAARAAASRVGKVNGDWIERAKAKGEDLSEYRATMGVSVKRTIMANPAERARRSELAQTTIVAWAQSEDGRKTSSTTAKLTSARPEIVAQRTENLRAWREREPEKFQAIVTKMIGCRTTKPEKMTLEFLQREFPEHDFKGNQRLMNAQLFQLTKSHKRQIDIMSRTRKLVVEVDGYIHFNNVKQWDQLASVHAKDAELNATLPLMGYTLVRVSYDQWNANTGELLDDCKNKLLSIVRSDLEPAVHYIGSMYNVTTFSTPFELVVAKLAERSGMSMFDLLTYGMKDHVEPCQSFDDFVKEWERT